MSLALNQWQKVAIYPLRRVPVGSGSLPLLCAAASGSESADASLQLALRVLAGVARFHLPRRPLYSLQQTPIRPALRACCPRAPAGRGGAVTSSGQARGLQGLRQGQDSRCSSGPSHRSGTAWAARSARPSTVAESPGRRRTRHCVRSRGRTSRIPGQIGWDSKRADGVRRDFLAEHTAENADGREGALRKLSLSHRPMELVPRCTPIPPDTTRSLHWLALYAPQHSRN